MILALRSMTGQPPCDLWCPSRTYILVSLTRFCCRLHMGGKLWSTTGPIAEQRTKTYGTLHSISSMSCLKETTTYHILDTSGAHTFTYVAHAHFSVGRPS